MAEPRASETILLVEDDESQRFVTTKHLSAAGYVILAAGSLAEAIALTRRHEIDVALLDLHLPDGTGLDLLARLRADDPDLPVIMLTQFANIRSAVEAMRLGAVDYLEKPYTIEGLEIALDRARTLNTLRREIRQLRRAASEGRGDFVRGASAAMNAVWQLVERVAPTDATVLISGPSGTGKDVVARAIHDASQRARGPFIPLNCGGLTETLAEDQLFGHEEHSFTDARKMRRGDFELADKGTLFLDEIGEMPLAVQPNLLRAIETRRFFRIGGEREIHADVRFLAATNRDLHVAVAQGTFREDLLFRLNVFAIELPPLCERSEDIPLLAAAFLHELGRGLGKPRAHVTPEALRLLKAYRWPGNIRQLRNVIERALILAPGQEIRPEHLPPEISGRPDVLEGPADEDTLWERWLEAAPFGDLQLNEVRHRVELFLVQRALRHAGGKRSLAAHTLGLSYETLTFRLKKLNMLAPDVAELFETDR
jgi:DNA-binding NtrC family response regulator